MVTSSSERGCGQGPGGGGAFTGVGCRRTGRRPPERQLLKQPGPNRALKGSAGRSPHSWASAVTQTARAGPGVAKALSDSLGHTVLWVPWKLSCASIKLQRGAGRLRTPSCGILSEKRGQRPNGGAASRSGPARASPSLSSQQQHAGDARPRPLRAGLWWGTRPAIFRNPTPRHGVRERRARRLVQPRVRTAR